MADVKYLVFNLNTETEINMKTIGDTVFKSFYGLVHYN